MHFDPSTYRNSYSKEFDKFKNYLEYLNSFSKHYYNQRVLVRKTDYLPRSSDWVVLGMTNLNWDVWLRENVYDKKHVLQHEIAHNLFPGIDNEDLIDSLADSVNLDSFDIVYV